MTTNAPQPQRPTNTTGPRLLTVYAHPDDESFGPAAALAACADAGWALAGLWFTPGQHGELTLTPPPPPDEVGRLRAADLRAAAAVIGYHQVEILDYMDGALAQAPAAELAARVLAAIQAFRPDVLLTFGPAGITRHPDHLAVHAAAVAAFAQARAAGLGVRELYYDAVPPPLASQFGIADEPDGQPNTRLAVAATFDRKLAALRCHARHVRDAQEQVARLEAAPRQETWFFRAWPPVPAGVIVPGFLAGARMIEVEHTSDGEGAQAGEAPSGAAEGE